MAFYSNSLQHPPIAKEYVQDMFCRYLSNYLMFMDISEDECHMLIGFAEISGTFWKSSINYFHKPKATALEAACEILPEIDNVICCGKILKSREKIIIGEDDGRISILSMEETGDEKFKFFTDVAAQAHDNSPVVSLSLSTDHRKLVSGAYNNCIKVWDINNTLTSQVTYQPAHNDLVNHVGFSPKNDEVFLSCSLDGSAKLWDMRLPPSQNSLKITCFEAIHASCWLENDNNYFALGTEMGNIFIFDSRTKCFVGKQKCFYRAVHQMVCDSRTGDIMAACSDTREIKAFRLSEKKILHRRYSDHTHEDSVRCLAWNSEGSKLYSSGFDLKIVCHDFDGNNEP